MGYVARGRVWALAGLAIPSVVMAVHLDPPIIAGERTPMPNEGRLTFSPNPVDFNQFGEEWTGWVDIRHPAADGTTNVDHGYDRANRQVSVKTILTTDNTAATVANPNGTPANPNIPRDFDYANKIWMQMGVSINRVQTGVTQIRLDGTGGTPNVSWTTGMNTGAHDDALKTVARAAAPTIDVYYIGTFDVVNNPNLVGLSSPPAIYRATNNDGIAISDGALNDTLAHELGHSILNLGNAAHVAGPNIMDATNHNFDFQTQIGPVGGRDVWTDGQIQTVFTPPAGGAPNGNNAGQVVPTATADEHRYGNAVDWDFVVDERRLETINTANSQPDNHPFKDALYFALGGTADLPPTEATHNTTGLGTFGNPVGGYGEGSFHYADVFSIAAWYSDYDQENGVEDYETAALDYNLFFRLVDGSVVPGELLFAFAEGWSDATQADDYLGRWFTPGDAVGVFIEAATGNGHDGIAQIDAVMVAQIPEPGILGVMAGVVVTLGMRSRRS